MAKYKVGGEKKFPEKKPTGPKTVYFTLTLRLGAVDLSVFTSVRTKNNTLKL